MIPKYLLYKSPLKREILLLITFLLIAFSSFSQTTKDSIHISRIQAVKIAKDLQAYNDLKQIDSLHQVNITYLGSQLSLKDTTISLLTLKVQFIQHINDDLIKTDSLQQDISKQYIKQNKLLKIERDGVGVVALAIIVKLLIK